LKYKIDVRESNDFGLSLEKRIYAQRACIYLGRLPTTMKGNYAGLCLVFFEEVGIILSQ